MNSAVPLKPGQVAMFVTVAVVASYGTETLRIYVTVLAIHYVVLLSDVDIEFT